MELKQYIETGIIESYVLGLATAEEAAEFLRLKALYPEVRAELAAVEQHVKRLLFNEAVRPPDAIRERILQSIGWEYDQQIKPRSS